VLLLSAVGVPGCPWLTHDFPTWKKGSSDHLVDEFGAPHLVGLWIKALPMVFTFQFEKSEKNNMNKSLG